MMRVCAGDERAYADYRRVRRRKGSAMVQPILVLGATGGQGGAVANALLERGVSVRALVRNAAKDSAQRLSHRGVELVEGSLDDHASLIAAMHGAAAVFVVTTPFEAGPGAEVAQGRTVVGAAVDTQVPHLVFSSVAGADQDSGVPHFESKRQIEQLLATTDLAHTVVAPTYFFDNALGGDDEIRHGILELPLPSDRGLQQLARSDLGEFVAQVLVDPARYVGQRVELASDAVTPEQMADTLSAALGRPVRHEQTPLESIQNSDMQAMWRFLNGPGYRVEISALKRANPSIAWTSFSEWAHSAFASEAPRRTAPR